MAKVLILLLLNILVMKMAIAQEFSRPYEYPVSSAPSTITYFDFDVTDSLYLAPDAASQLVYRDLIENLWYRTDMDLLNQACSTHTYEGSISYQPASNLLEWYFRSENDTAVVSQSPQNNDDLFPVPDYLLADLGADDVGDAVGGGSHLDIVHLFASYSDSKLFFHLDNNSGGFPTSGGILTYYLYSVGLINPNATDSVAYVLLYASNPLYSTGLYALDLTDSSLVYIAPISSTVSGNSLSLSCNIADLVAQPGWPEWPPDLGFVGVAPVTGTANLTDISYNDFGKSAMFIPSSHLLDFAAVNTPPVLSDQNVTFTPSDLVTAEITYSDVDNHLPVLRRLNFEGVWHDLQACQKEFASGAVFSIALTVTEEKWYRYHFEFSDGVATVATALDSLYVNLGCCVGTSVGNMDGTAGTPDMGDLTLLIDMLFISLNELPCLQEADVDFSNQPNPIATDITMGDLTVLIDNLFISLDPLPPCP